jgi:hypothetical protein
MVSVKECVTLFVDKHPLVFCICEAHSLIDFLQIRFARIKIEDGAFRSFFSSFAISESLLAGMDSPFSYSRGPPVQYVMQRSDGSATFTRGVSVLRWMIEQIRADKELVQFLVWSNPSNLCYASPALQADPDIVSTALQSP